MKPANPLSDALFSAVDVLTKRVGLYCAAVADFLAGHAEREVTARLNRLYASEPSVLDRTIRRAQGRSLKSDSWWR